MNTEDRELLDKIVRCDLQKQESIGKLLLTSSIISFFATLVLCAVVSENTDRMFLLVLGAYSSALLATIGAAKRGYCRLYRIVKQLTKDGSTAEAPWPEPGRAQDKR